MEKRFPITLLDFQRMFPDQGACCAYLEQVRWPDGFACPWCNAVGTPYRFENRPTLFRCRDCQRDTYLTAGTVMHSTRTPLQVWFWAAYLVTTQTPGMSALQFQRQLGLTRYETAFQMLHKLRAAMVRPDRDRIGMQWPVELDETLVGGKTRGEGRGVHHKTYVVGAVEVRSKVVPHGRQAVYAGRLRLQVADDRSKRSLEPFVTENIQPNSRITTDGWHGYDNLAAMGYDHKAVVLAGDPDKTDKELPMIHLIFSNLKAWLLGTHHGVSAQHLPAYLNEFVFRFNRRFYPMTAFASALGIGAHVAGPTYDDLYDGVWVHPTAQTKS
jgi:transposase-like protein